MDGTNTIREEELPNGSKFAYGRDYDGTITSISQSTKEGEENSTQKTYRNGEVVELKSGNNNVKYTYNHKRKLTSVDLNGEENYVQYAYEEEEDWLGHTAKETVTATYKKSAEAFDVFITEKNENGDILKLTANNTVQLENVYNTKGQLVTLNDKVSNTTYNFERDSLDNLTKVYEVDNTDESKNYCEEFEYDEFGNVVKKTLSGAFDREYSYTYTTDSKQLLQSMDIDGNTIKPKFDVLDRNAGKEIFIDTDKIAEESITYRKVGDHATNMPSTVWFGSKVNNNYIIKDNLKYAYDNTLLYNNSTTL